MNFTERRQLLFQIVLVSIFMTLISGLVAIYLPSGIDWHEAFRPATLALISGKSPYDVEKFYAAPWALIPLIPIALLPENIGRGVLFLLDVISIAFIAYRLGAKPLVIVAILLSPPSLHGLLNANIDWLAMLGFVLPPQIGLFFVLIKPQVGIGLAIFWFVKIWRDDGYKELIKAFTPLILVTTISFVIFGIWPMRFLGITKYSSSFNASFWPSSIPIGLVLLTTSMRKDDARYAIASSPCFSPHVLFHSYVGALVALLPATAETIVAVIGLWILVIIRAFSGAL